MKKATKIVTKVITVAIAVMMISGSASVFATELPYNTRTGIDRETTLLPLNTGDDGNGSAGGQGNVNQTVHIGSSSGHTIGGFVDRLYTYTLHRSADEAGRAYWVDLLSSRSRSGSEVANGFFFSQEFIGLNLTNEQFVTTLYWVFFDRSPDQAGYAYWLDKLNGGMTRAQVISGFTGSVEWAGICNQFGINA